MSGVGSAITKQAVGRRGFIGSLYDIRSDRFEGGNLFNKELASSLILTTDSASSDYFVDENLSQKDTFNKLNIEAQMKLSIMAGVINVEGTAKYLNQTKTDSRTVRVTIMFNVKTKQQHLQVSMADLCNYFSPDALENQYATHCVTGITWGARIAATFEETFATAEAAEELQGQLAASLKKATINISGQANLENAERTNSKFHSLKISFSGDVLIEDVPHTVDDVFNIFKKVPSMLKQLNDGKGQQLEFELYPLKAMADKFKYELRIVRIFKEVANSVIHRIENIFEQIIEGKRMINDFLARIGLWKDWISSDWIDVIHVKKAELMRIELETQRRLALLLEQSRRGEAEEKEMTELLDNFNIENPCSVRSIKQFLKEHARIDAKIEALSRFDRMTIEKGEEKLPKEPNPDLLLKQITSIDDLISKYYDDDVYLLNISNEWEGKDKANWYKQLRYFNNLQKVEIKAGAKKSIFRVIDYDLHTDLDNKPCTCTIYYAFHGTIKSQDYYHTSLTTLSPQQVQAIRTENKCTDLNNKDIEEWHKKFIEAHPIGELDEKDFIDEFQKLFPDGNPGPYCTYAYNTIDKDHSGTISFAEFMSARSLTLPGNIEKQLTLVFAMCDYHTQGKVSGDELIQLLAAVAELKGGDCVVDSNATKSVVQKMMEFRKKANDEKITKEEFIACLKDNRQLYTAFLPILANSSPLTIAAVPVLEKSDWYRMDTAFGSICMDDAWAKPTPGSGEPTLFRDILHNGMMYIDIMTGAYKGYYLGGHYAKGIGAFFSWSRAGYMEWNCGKLKSKSGGTDGYDMAYKANGYFYFYAGNAGYQDVCVTKVYPYRSQ